MKPSPHLLFLWLIFGALMSGAHGLAAASDLNTVQYEQLQESLDQNRAKLLQIANRLEPEYRRYLVQQWELENAGDLAWLKQYREQAKAAREANPRPARSFISRSEYVEVHGGDGTNGVESYEVAKARHELLESLRGRSPEERRDALKAFSQSIPEQAQTATTAAATTVARPFISEAQYIEDFGTDESVEPYAVAKARYELRQSLRNSSPEVRRDALKQFESSTASMQKSGAEKARERREQNLAQLQELMADTPGSSPAQASLGQTLTEHDTATTEQDWVSLHHWIYQYGAYLVHEISEEPSTTLEPIYEN